MFGRSGKCLLAVLFLILAPLFSISQTDRNSSGAQIAPHFPPRIIFTPTPQPAPIFPRLPVRPGVLGFSGMARAAGMIFSGTVTGIERHPANRGQSVETVAIDFHIENVIRGAAVGENLIISQWIGLLSSGQRYRVGERVLLFLYPRSKLGLTSCVAGPMGRFDIDAWGHVLLSAQQVSAFRTDSVLGGKSRAGLSDFALAVRRAGEEE